MDNVTPDYEIVIIGAGAAGLSLACSLIESSWKDRQILLIEPDSKQKNDRTWCFWSKDGAGQAQIAFRSWANLAFTHSEFAASFQLEPYRYWMVRGIDFYEDARRRLSAFPNIHWLKGSVDLVQDEELFAAVRVGEQWIQARWLFDSRPPQQGNQSSRYHHLKQHFKGLVIRTEQDAFNPDVPVLFDFRTPQQGAMRFFYVLPYDQRTALVEYTLFSEMILKEEEYDCALHAYIVEVLKPGSYQTLEEERGVIPMSDQPLPRQLGKRWMAIGTRGGRVKPSSGYAFLRILKDSKAIVQALEANGNPFFKNEQPRRYPIFDRIMLQVMQRDGDRMATIFTRLFQRNPIERIFRFLDEEGSLWGDLRLIGSLPWGPFLRAVWRIWIRRQIHAINESGAETGGKDVR